MLEDGVVDALFVLQFPSFFQKGSPRVTRLFPNYKEVEQDYYRRTRIFPIMHTVVIRDDVYREHPWVARSIFRAFCEARDLAVSGLYDTDALRLTLPWLISHVEETWQVFGKDFWSYGVHENLREIEALTQYAHEQGLVDRKVAVEELFARSVFEISKI